MRWLTDAERIQPEPHTDGGGYVSGVPWRLVLHTTEGHSLDGAVAAYRDHSGWPHLTLSYTEDRVAQHLSLQRAARALRHTEPPQTNRARAVQVEVVGFARATHEWADRRYRWLAEILAPVVADLRIGLHGPSDWPGSSGYGEPAAQRMGDHEWLRFDGVCGHSHVPGNTHYDPGRFRLDRFLAHLRTLVTQEDDMPKFELVQWTGHGGVYLVKDDMEKRVVTSSELQRLADEHGPIRKTDNPSELKALEPRGDRFGAPRKVW